MYAGALARYEAARSLVRAASGRVATDAEAFGGLVFAALEQVRAATAVRTAAVARTEARVRAAHAAGWPTARVLSGGAR
jgi:hypothetical protein